jgi:hypothetical protein
MAVALRQRTPLCPPAGPPAPMTRGADRAVAAPGDVLRTRFIVTPCPGRAPTEPYFLRAPRRARSTTGSGARLAARGCRSSHAVVRHVVSSDARRELCASARRRVRRTWTRRRRGAAPLHRRAARRPSPWSRAPSPSRSDARSAHHRRHRALRFVARRRHAHAARSRRLARRARDDVVSSHAGDGAHGTLHRRRRRRRAGHTLISARFAQLRFGGTFDRGYTLIDYPHIRPHAALPRRHVRTSVFPSHRAGPARRLHRGRRR